MTNIARNTRGRKMANKSVSEDIVENVLENNEEEPSKASEPEAKPEAGDVTAEPTADTEAAAESSTPTETMDADAEDAGGTEETPKPLAPEEDPDAEKVDFKVMFSKKKFDVTFALDGTVGKLKEHLQGLTGVPPDLQKVMIKGLAANEKTLRELGVSQGAKVLVVGSKLDDVLSVSAPTAEELAAGQSSSKEKEALSSQTMHKKVLDKGKPDDALPGIKGVKEPLPQVPLSGMLNKQGRKVRLTFKLEMDQMWIGTQQRTEKISMNSIKGVVSEPIAGHDEYHIMAIQLGPTEASRYWIYWVPAQYVDAIKDAILGKWQYF